MPEQRATLPEYITRPPRPPRLPAAEHVRRIRLVVAIGRMASAAISVGLVLAGVDVELAMLAGMTSLALSAQLGVGMATRRIRQLAQSLSRQEAAVRETLSPVDRLDQLAFRFASKLPDIYALDQNELDELQVLRQAKQAGWIGDHEGVRSGRTAVPRIGRQVEAKRIR